MSQTLEYRSGPGTLSASAPRRPTCITVIAVLGIIVGGLMMITAPGDLAGLRFEGPHKEVGVFTVLSIVSAFARSILAPIYLAGSIGLLGLRPVARKMVLTCSLLFVFLWVFGGVTFLALSPSTNTSPATPRPLMAGIITVVVLAIGSLTGLVLPVVTWLYLDSVKVRALFKQNETAVVVEGSEGYLALAAVRFIAVVGLMLAGTRLLELVNLVPSYVDWIQGLGKVDRDYRRIPLAILEGRPQYYHGFELILVTFWIVGCINVLMRRERGRVLLLIICFALAVESGWGWGHWLAELTHSITGQRTRYGMTAANLRSIALGSFGGYICWLVYPAVTLLLLTNWRVRGVFATRQPAL